MLGELLAREGRRAEAESRLRRALALFQQLGDEPSAQRTRSMISTIRAWHEDRPL